jgi:myo-inositol-1-phosphate synthase
MIVQFIWQGCDSMLAAPLALDLIRLTDFAHRRGESGAEKHLACFFKDPLEGETHDFWKQWEILKSYVHSRSQTRTKASARSVSGT